MKKLSVQIVLILIILLFSLMSCNKQTQPESPLETPINTTASDVTQTSENVDKSLSIVDVVDKIQWHKPFSITESGLKMLIDIKPMKYEGEFADDYIYDEVEVEGKASELKVNESKVEGKLSGVATVTFLDILYGLNLSLNLILKI